MNTLFERSVNTKDEWLTPPEIFTSLGVFDLDPCSPVKRPWDTAKNHYSIEDNGFTKEWEGRIWLNPPYSECDIWLQRLANHGNGIALTFARTDTNMFHRYVWNRANAIFFIKGRIKFYSVDGNAAKMNAGAPSVLIAYGKENTESLRKCGIKGHFQNIENIPDFQLTNGNTHARQ